MIGRQFLLLEIPEEAAEPAQFTVEGVVRHWTREAKARAAQGQDEGRMGGEAFKDVSCVHSISLCRGRIPSRWRTAARTQLVVAEQMVELSRGQCWVVSS